MTPAHERPCSGEWPVRISPARPLLFVHIYKAAGLSVDAFLTHRFPDGQLCRLERMPPDPGALGGYACYSGHVLYALRDKLPK